MKKVRILTVCGSGVVTSSMIANKLEDLLGEKGFRVEAEEAMPGELETRLSGKKFDLVAYSTPIGDTHGVPALDAIGLVTGRGDEEFVEKAIEIFNRK